MYSLMIVAIIAGVSLVVGAGAGWGIKGWKDGTEIAHIKSQQAAVESQNAILVTANTNCAIDIEGAKKGVAVVVAQAEEREKAASDAMRAADLKITKRMVSIKIRELPPVLLTPDAQCAAIVKEQFEYIQERKSAS